MVAIAMLLVTILQTCKPGFNGDERNSCEGDSAAILHILFHLFHFIYLFHFKVTKINR